MRKFEWMTTLGILGTYLAQNKIKYNQHVKLFGSDQLRHFDGPDLDPYSLRTDPGKCSKHKCIVKPITPA